MIWGQTRCPVYRSGTFNVQRSTLNLQWGDRKGAWWAGYGDRHVIWTTGLLPRRSCRSAGGTVEAGCGTQIWGQTRNSEDRAFDPVDLPKHLSGGRGLLRHPDMGTDTMSDIPIRNVQLSTFNWVTERARSGAGYGDRHGIWADGLLTRWTCPSAGQAVEAAPGHPDLGTGTMFGGRQNK